MSEAQRISNADPVSVVFLGHFIGCGFCRRMAPAGEFECAPDCPSRDLWAAVAGPPAPGPYVEDHGELRWDRLMRRWAHKHERI